MSKMRDRAIAASEELVGTAKTLREVLGDDYEMLRWDKEFCEALDEHVMECQSCNWWAEADEFDEDQLCADCQ